MDFVTTISIWILFIVVFLLRVGDVTLVYAASPRRARQTVVRTVKATDPDLFYVIEPAQESSRGVHTRIRPVPHATGWRVVFKKR